MSVDFINQFLSISKATHFCVAFFISFSAFGKTQSVAQGEDFNLRKWTEVKSQISKLIVEKNKQAALKIIAESEFLAKDSKLSSAFYLLKENILTLFLNQETQDLYESASATLIQNIRLSEKNTLKCLDFDSENLLCKWQYLKVLNFKNDPRFRSQADLFIAASENLPGLSPLALTLNINVVPQSGTQLNLQKTNPVLFHILEFERSLKNQNYSLAKEAVQSLSGFAADYPDLIYMRAKLSELSTETSVEQNFRMLQNIYKKKCASLSLEMTRKYFYDIHLCHRGF
jgi:hypothetical protein